MFKEYYNRQLRRLRKDAKEFASLYPAIAPMLAGQSPDPDVERLLEGFAFLTGLLQEKLDDEYPELIHGLLDLVFPHYLRPWPAVTLIEFRPKPALKESIVVAEGTAIASKEIDGNSCLFKTSSDMTLHPLKLEKAEFHHADGRRGIIQLFFELQDIPLETWNPADLRFCLNAGYSDAADLLMLLQLHAESIVITPETDGESCHLDASSLQPAGFRDREQLLPYSERSFSGYRILQEYFLFPQKFLFIDILDLDRWKNKGKGNRFMLEFRLSPFTFPPPVIGKETFLLHVVPAVNLFPLDAEPVTVDQRDDEYIILPSGWNSGEFDIYSVDRVEGIHQGQISQRTYIPFESFYEEMKISPLYETRRRRSKAGLETDLSLRLMYPEQVKRYERETLSIALTCSNGNLPERLGLGDICRPTSTSPELATFRNIIAPAPAIQMSWSGNLRWHLLSHLVLNFFSVASRENLKTLLNLYIVPEDRDKSRVAANMRKVTGIEALSTTPARRLFRGMMIHGTEIDLSLDKEHFSSLGDLHLFGSVLDHFFSVYSIINSYTQMNIDETHTGKQFRWKARVGERFLL